MRVHYPKLRNIVHSPYCLPLNVFTASKGSNLYILIRKRIAKITNTLVFSFYIAKINLSDINVDCPVNALKQLENHDVKTNACRVAAKKKLSPISIATGLGYLYLPCKSFQTDINIRKSWLKQNQIGRFMAFSTRFSCT